MFIIIFRTCRPFLYSGCDGNDNRFETEAECRARCPHDPHEEPTCPLGFHLESAQTGAAIRCGGRNDVRCPPQSICHYDGRTSACCPSNGFVCSLDVEKGSACSRFPQRRFYYDASRGQCAPFAFLGCDGNANNFPSLQTCLEACNGGGLPPEDACGDRSEPAVTSEHPPSPSCVPDRPGLCPEGFACSYSTRYAQYFCCSRSRDTRSVPICPELFSQHPLLLGKKCETGSCPKDFGCLRSGQDRLCCKLRDDLCAGGALVGDPATGSLQRCERVDPEACPRGSTCDFANGVCCVSASTLAPPVVTFVTSTTPAPRPFGPNPPRPSFYTEGLCPDDSDSLGKCLHDKECWVINFLDVCVFRKCCPSCRKLQREARAQGRPMPDCTLSGRYKKAMQCDAASNLCYCVTAFGSQIPGSVKPRGQLTLEECRAQRLDYVVPRLVNIS